MVTLISHDAGQTEAIGGEWGHAAARGWVIGLSGDLGAGKTVLVKGIAQGLGITARVHSPTFALVNEYRGGRLPMVHLDLYRMETRAEIVGAGLEEYFDKPSGVVAVEWMERWFGEQKGLAVRSLSARYRKVLIETLAESERRVTYEDIGA